jgi:hypothetical protein
MHVDERDEVALVAQQWRRRKLRCVGGSWLFVVTRSVPVTHIYRKDLPRVTASHNRLYLSLSKCIRHRLIAKINNKRRSWTCEALSRISVDDSCAHRLATPCHTTQHHATSGPARRASACVCFSLSPFLHTLTSV